MRVRGEGGEGEEGGSHQDRPCVKHCQEESTFFALLHTPATVLKDPDGSPSQEEMMVVIEGR